jgi:hypothetical protein
MTSLEIVQAAILATIYGLYDVRHEAAFTVFEVNANDRLVATEARYFCLQVPRRFDSAVCA